MSLNCRPGDLAIVVAVPKDGSCDHCVGRLVTVTKTQQWSHAVSWYFVWNGSPSMARQDGSAFFTIPDFALRPIRDPGDDAQDESFRWATAPEKVTV